MRYALIFLMLTACKFTQPVKPLVTEDADESVVSLSDQMLPPAAAIKATPILPIISQATPEPTPTEDQKQLDKCNSMLYDDATVIKNLRQENDQLRMQVEALKMQLETR